METINGTTNPSPKATKPTDVQQQQFDLLLGRAREMMEKNGDQWIVALKKQPVIAAVSMGVSTIRGMAQMSEKAGQPVDPAVLLHVGIQFVKDIAAVANAAGAVPDEKIEAFLKDVMSQSIMQYLKLDAKDGLIKPGDKKAAQGILARMQGGEEGEMEPPGEGAGPDNTDEHEGTETPETETAEGAEEDSPDDPEMAQELKAIRARKGAM